MNFFMILIFIFIAILIFIGFYKRVPSYVEYEINLNNIDPNKGLNWYKEEVRKQINALLFTIDSTHDKTITYKAPLLYLVNEDFITVEYDVYYVKIKSSKMVKKIFKNLLEIDF